MSSGAMDGVSRAHAHAARRRGHGGPRTRRDGAGLGGESESGSPARAVARILARARRATATARTRRGDRASGPPNPSARTETPGRRAMGRVRTRRRRRRTSHKPARGPSAAEADRWRASPSSPQYPATRWASRPSCGSSPGKTSRSSAGRASSPTASSPWCPDPSLNHPVMMRPRQRHPKDQRPRSTSTCSPRSSRRDAAPPTSRNASASRARRYARLEPSSSIPRPVNPSINPNAPPPTTATKRAGPRTKRIQTTRAQCRCISARGGGRTVQGTRSDARWLRDRLASREPPTPEDESAPKLANDGGPRVKRQPRIRPRRWPPRWTS